MFRGDCEVCDITLRCNAQVERAGLCIVADGNRMETDFRIEKRRRSKSRREILY